MKAYRAKNKKYLSKLNKHWRAQNKDYIKDFKYSKYSSIHGRILEMLKGARKRSKLKNIPYELDTEWLKILWEQQDGKCALTGIEFIIPQKRTGCKSSPFSPSLDRIDCSKGYVKENVRIVCVAVNYALNEFGEKVFQTIANAYINSMSKTK